MRRLPDWQCRLERFLLDSQHTPFAYGAWDCCLFVAGAVAAITGTDMAAEFRGRYRSRREALALSLERTGRRSTTALAHAVFSSFGLPIVPAAAAQRGDVVQVARRHKAVLGVLHFDGQRAIVPTELGLQCIPRIECLRAWRV